MLVTIDTYINYFEAHIVRGRLEAEGIHTYVVHDNHISIDWWIALALGYIKIQVHPSDINEGIKILKKIDMGDFANMLDDDGLDEIQLICPNCNNQNIIFDYFSKRIALAFLFINMPVPYSSATVKCLECRNSWRDKSTITYDGFFLFWVSLIAIIFLYHLGSTFLFFVNHFEASLIEVFPQLKINT